MLNARFPKVAIVGATGAVGRELLRLMQERKFRTSGLSLVASERSAGQIVRFAGEAHVVQDLKRFDFRQVDIAFFSAGTSISREWARKAANQGAVVIDNTNAFRMEKDCPLIVPQVNGHLLGRPPASGIIANPNCSTIQMVRILEPIHREFSLRRVIVSTYQAASGAGLTGMSELERDTRAQLAPPTNGEKTFGTRRFPQPLAFNVVPQVDVLQEDGFTLEEQKMVQESRKILDLPALDLTATAVRVPVINGHSEAVYLETERPLDIARVTDLLRSADEVTVYDESTASPFPTPRFMDSPNHVHVGRIRRHAENPHGMWAWIVADNLRIGAALNAIQVAERLLEKAAVAS